jgi:phosphoribosyl-ATP pyrophosphohydrolase/phosphoribosyl-AMP cyclohydrolase
VTTHRAADPAPRYGPDGLVPAVVQDAGDGRVLMVAFMDAEALTATLKTGEVHFHSRSRGRLWRKGETSGNVLRLAGFALDCDGDALLIQAVPTGPTCHRGTRSCFDPIVDPTETGPSPAVPDGPGLATDQGFAWLEILWATIRRRGTDRPAGSYTTTLLDGGVDVAGRKVTEEATEVLLAARDDAELERAGAAVASEDRGRSRDALAGEAADLLYHLLVLLAERDLPPAMVMDRLQARHRS